MTTYAKYLRRGRPFAYTLRRGGLRTKGVVFAIDERDARERAAGTARYYYGDDWGVLEVQRIGWDETKTWGAHPLAVQKKRKGTLPRLKGWRRRLMKGVT